MELTNKVALITGASGFLGRAIAPELARAGAALALHFHQNEQRATSLQQQTTAAGGVAKVYQADLRQVASAEALIDHVLADFHRLHVIIHAAGTFHRTPFGHVTAEHWDQVFEIQVKGFFFLAQKAAAALRAAQGKIVIFSDVAAFRPYRAHIPYSAAKAALNSLNQSLALALAPEVTVNAIAPGIIHRPEAPDAVDERLSSKIPLQRFGTAQEVAHAVLFLLQEADYTTGTVLRLDGGRLLNAQ